MEGVESSTHISLSITMLLAHFNDLKKVIIHSILCYCEAHTGTKRRTYMYVYLFFLSFLYLDNHKNTCSHTSVSIHIICKKHTYYCNNIHYIDNVPVIIYVCTYYIPVYPNINTLNSLLANKN